MGFKDGGILRDDNVCDGYRESTNIWSQPHQQKVISTAWSYFQYQKFRRSSQTWLRKRRLQALLCIAIARKDHWSTTSHANPDQGGSGYASCNTGRTIMKPTPIPFADDRSTYKLQKFGEGLHFRVYFHPFKLSKIIFFIRCNHLFNNNIVLRPEPCCTACIGLGSARPEPRPVKLLRRGLIQHYQICVQGMFIKIFR